MNDDQLAQVLQALEKIAKEVSALRGEVRMIENAVRDAGVAISARR